MCLGFPEEDLRECFIKCHGLMLTCGLRGFGKGIAEEINDGRNHG